MAAGPAAGAAEFIIAAIIKHQGDRAIIDAAFPANSNDEVICLKGKRGSGVNARWLAVGGQFFAHLLLIATMALQAIAALAEGLGTGVFTEYPVNIGLAGVKQGDSGCV